MNRCIQCTRCVRFATEVAGVPELGAIGRGEDMEITTYLEHAMTSELQGNVVDLCPVGALTSKPYAFVARPWELAKTESIDVMDAVGSAIRVDTRGREVMRILPRLNEDVNEEWISDKTRHVVDGLRVQRLDQPYLREGGRLRPASWSEAFRAVAAKVRAARPGRIGAIAGDLAAVEEMFALKDLLARLGSKNIDCRQDGSALHPAWGARPTFSIRPSPGIERADALVIVGSNPRREAAVLNARIRKRWRMGPFAIGLIGERVDLTYPYHYLGAGPDTLAELAAGRGDFADILKKAERPIVMLGAGATARPDGAAIAALAAKAAVDLGAVKDGWNGFAVLHNAAARVGGLDIGFVPGEGGLKAAEMAAGARARRAVPARGRRDRRRARRLRRLYRHAWRPRRTPRRRHPAGRRLHRKIGHLRQHRGAGADGGARGLPAGRCARGLGDSARAVGRARHRLPFDSLAQLRAALFNAHPHLARLDAIAPGRLDDVRKLAARGGALDSAPFGAPIADFYLTNPDRPRLRGHGRVLGARRGRHGVACGGVMGMSIAELWSTYLWPLLIIVIQSFALLAVLLIVIAYVLYADRKIWAAVQIRRGPNVVGPWGLLQSFADMLKFALKEPTIPDGANKGLFILAPLVTCVLALAAWAVIPVNDGWVVADINVGILYIFAISSLSVYGIIMARLGVELEIRLPRRAALGRADGVLRGLDRLRDHHRAAVRRLAQPVRHRQGAGHALGLARLVLAAAPADVRDLLHLGAGRDQPRRRSTWSRRSPSSSPASWSNTARRPTCCSCSANTWRS